MGRTALFSRKQPGGVFTIDDIAEHPGDIFFVDSGNSAASDAAGFGKNPDAPFATLDYAIGNCTANNGDVIYLMPGHAETLEAASAVTIDVAGITVIGLGEGADRPTLTFSTDVGASIVISSASFKMKNVIGLAGVDSLTNPLHVQAADCELDIEWQDASDTVEAVRAILTTAAADRLKLNLKYRGRTGGNACVNAVRLVGCDGADILIDFYGKASTSIVEFHTTACSDVDVKGVMYNSGTTDGSKDVIDTATGSTWSAQIWDATAAAFYSGGSGSALASDDISTINSLIGAINGTTTDSLHGKIGTDTEMADNSLYDLLGAGSKTLDISSAIGSSVDGTTTDNLHGKIGTDTEMADNSLYDLLGAGSKTLSLSSAIGSDVDSATTDNLHGKIGTDTEMADSSLFDILAGAAGIASFPSGAAPANNVSIAEVIRFIYDALAGTVGLASFPSGAAAANDVSLAEVLRYVQENIIVGSGTALPSNQSIYDLIAGTNGIAAFPSAAVAANGISIAEVLRYVQEQQLWQLATKAYTFSGDGGGQGAISLFTVTGDVEIEIFGICKDAFTSGGAATIEVGVSGNTAALIAQTTATDLIANEIWHDATPTTTLESLDTISARRFVISNGQDIILTIATADTTAGDCTFYCRWRPLSSDGAVA